MFEINSKSDDVIFELHNDQHWVTAMLNLLQETTKQTDQRKWVAHSVTKNYHWTINVYALELLTLQSTAALTVNCEIMQKLNSEEFNAIQIITHFNNVSESEQPAILKPKSLGNWLNNIFELCVEHTAHMLTVLSNDFFCPLFLHYCMTHYEEQYFF